MSYEGIFLNTFEYISGSQLFQNHGTITIFKDFCGTQRKNKTIYRCIFLYFLIY